MLSFKNKHVQKVSLLSNDHSECSINASKRHAKSSIINEKYNNNIQSEKKTKSSLLPSCCIATCSYKCACLSTSLTTAIIVVIVSIVLFVSVFPNVAQNTLDNATMDIIDGTIYNPTNSSITLNTSIRISNVGMFSGSIPATTVTVYNQNIRIGTMKMPSIQTIANTPSIVTVLTTLNIENKAQFQKSCKKLLENTDQIWTISASNIKISVQTGLIGSFEFTVHLNKNLILSGAQLYDFVASDFNVNRATNTTVTAISNLDFAVNSVLKFILPPTALRAYINETYVGFAPLPNGIQMENGHNIMRNQSLIIQASDTNRKVIGHFFGEYIMNKDQNITLRGPYSDIVIDGVLEVTAIARGYALGTLAFGGVVTSESQLGWTVGKKGIDVRGAYANMLNPLNVPLRVHHLSADVWTHMYLEYDVTLLLVDTYKCKNTSQYAQLHIGPGINKTNASVTWVDIGPNSWTSFFTIAQPFIGSQQRVNSSSKGCMGIMPFDCCFATMTTAYVCALNPGLKGEEQLTHSFMPLRLYSNLTLEVDYPNGFMVNITYNEGFFPTYFGYQIYAGYVGDAWLDCGCYKYKYIGNMTKTVW